MVRCKHHHHFLDGSARRHHDPRALVDACRALKLTFDVYQQNDASEFSVKLLDPREDAMMASPQTGLVMPVVGTPLQRRDLDTWTVGVLATHPARPEQNAEFEAAALRTFSEIEAKEEEIRTAERWEFRTSSSR